MSCMFLSVYTSRSWSCMATGTCRTTWHVLVGIHVQKLVVHGEGVIADYLELRRSRERVYFPLLIADRDVEIVEDQRDSGYRRSVRRRNREGQLLATTTSATTTSAASAAGEEESAL